MTDFYLDPETWDLVIEAGEIKIVTDGTEEMVQRIGVALKTHKGEWLYDTERGLPWQDEIFVKSPDFPRITNLIDTYVRSIEGVTDILLLEVGWSNRAERKLRISLDVEIAEGTTGPFNLDFAI